MTTGANESPSSQDAAGQSKRHQEWVRRATFIGLGLATVGLVDGLVMALNREEAPCSDGKYFPEGTTDFTCYIHPQAGLGIAIAVISVLLGILIVLTGIAARASLNTRAPTS
jgi:hypothetical protein